MPKRTRDFPANMNFNCATELRQKLVAISYLRGDGGSYAAPARDILTDGVELFLSQLPETRRKDFEEILETVRAREALLTGNKKAPP